MSRTPAEILHDAKTIAVGGASPASPGWSTSRTPARSSSTGASYGERFLTRPRLSSLERGNTAPMAYGLLLLRIVIGGTLFAPGAQKLFGWFDGPGPRGTAA